MKAKSSVDEIRARFDADVERFSNLETGQKATIDAPLAMELITMAAAACNPGAKAVLDIGCGAGNNTLTFDTPLMVSNGTPVVLTMRCNTSAATPVGSTSPRLTGRPSGVMAQTT